MGKLGQNTFNKKVIDAFVSTPLIILAPTKRKRKSAAKKWFNLLLYANKR